MGWKFFVFAGIILLFAIAAMLDQPKVPATGQAPTSSKPESPFTKEITCTADADCVPAICCHAAQCVPISQKPDCTGVVCTDECRPATLDCGQLKCGCVAGKCVTKLF